MFSKGVSLINSKRQSRWY